MAVDPWTGRVIDGRYLVEAVVGQGGMGVVLRARHRFTGAQVALKMLRLDLQFEPQMQERFLAEARASSAIGHPGIVNVYDAGKTPEGELYLAMELLDGRPLRSAMYPQLPATEARRIMRELLDALGAAHARGIIHRDLKPENVFLVGPGAKVKLLDFGIAKVAQSSTRAGGFTAAGAVLGTIAYMAPEQLQDASSVDARADLWAVGVMLYELLSGHLPYRGAHVSELMQSLASEEPTPISQHLPGTPPAISAFFARALSRDRARRFSSAQELATALGQLPLEAPLTPPPVMAPVMAPVRPPPAPVPKPNQRRLHGIILGSALLIASVLVMVGLADRDPPSPDADELCERGCATLESCGVTMDRCLDQCRQDPPSQECLRSAGGTCQALGMCMFGNVCKGVAPHGSTTCTQAAMCQTQCTAADPTCSCRCIAELAPEHTVALLGLTLCLGTFCKDGGGTQCAVSHCAAAIQKCTGVTVTP